MISATEGIRRFQCIGRNDPSPTASIALASIHNGKRPTLSPKRPSHRSRPMENGRG
jgi:hypothetical protein